MTTPANTILQGDCLEVLKSLDDSSIDAVCTDPPYGLGTREPTGEEIDRYLSGGSLDTGGDFMGREWEIPPVAVWKECLRVLRPGGHLLSFAGTRTWDIMAAGIDAAGFDDKDTLASHFTMPLLAWIHSQGFPKSLDIAKAIDKMRGEEPEVVGPYRTPEGGQVLSTYNNWQSDDIEEGSQGRKVTMVTKPTSEDAKKWQGWGTALKPAWEPILVYRKPGSGPYTGPRPVVPFQYCAKVSKSEATKKGEIENTHPTRKPLALMQWLVKLVATEGQLILDPYCGSGTTCVASILEKRSYLGIEREPAFFAIADKRAMLYNADRSDNDSQVEVFNLMADMPQEDF